MAVKEFYVVDISIAKLEADLCGQLKGEKEKSPIDFYPKTL